MFSNLMKQWRVTVPAAALTAGVLTGGTYAVNQMAAAPAADSAAVTTASASTTAPLETVSYADTVAKALPAVVTVEVEKRVERASNQDLPDEFFRRFFGPQTPQRGGDRAPLREGVGSGVIVSADGTILTNNHVVEDAEHITIRMHDGRTYTAKVVGTDPPTDLAVLDIEGANLPTLPLADSNRVRVGDVVLAVGNPLNLGQTVTMGIISAKSRTTGRRNDAYEDFLQTDAPINQGNSGGALITTGGELVGINSQILSLSGGNMGIGFAIPSNLARNVMGQLVATGKVRRSMIGVSVQPVTSNLADALGLTAVKGAVVSDVVPGSPAEKAGLERQDVILKVDGVEVSDSNDLRNRISTVVPGEAVTVEYIRDGKPRTSRIVVTERTTDDAAPSRSTEDPANRDFGMSLNRLTPELAERFQLEGRSTGVIVTDVQPGSAAARAGIAPGDIVRTIDRQSVSTPAEARQELTKSRTRPAVVVVERDGNSLILALPTR
jgi:Do/DeqQ family serine protease